MDKGLGPEDTALRPAGISIELGPPFHKRPAGQLRQGGLSVEHSTVSLDTSSPQHLSSTNVIRPAGLSQQSSKGSVDMEFLFEGGNGQVVDENARLDRESATKKDFDKLLRYRTALEEIQSKAKGPSHQRSYSFLWSIILLVILAVIIIVIVYLFTVGNTDKDTQKNVSVENICNEETVEECMKGLREQFKDDTTAALRSPVHYLFTFAAFLITVLFFSCSTRRKYTFQQRILDSLPDNEVDLWRKDKVGISRPQRTQPFNLDVFFVIQEYLSKAVILKNAQQILVEKRIADSPDECKDPNWGYIGSPNLEHGNVYKSKVNYKHCTAGSFEIISEIATKRHPDLAIEPWETVRDYMTRLKKVCTSGGVLHRIDASKCDQFVLFYEDAKFGQGDFDVTKWKQVQENLEYFHRYFQ
mmetsp:Transcript_1945/g.3871  ORF Transcript_1945/g.3871 Transcript_1945/m.3871 type:complete len:414 (+) Transcript_1945:2429-3670(+)